MAGGSFNRITGVKIIGSEGENPIVLVLRTPRNAWDSRPDREVATLEYIRHHTGIPVPQIKAFDFSEENPLKGPYVVQNRIPGLSFEMAIRNGISHKQWCTMAKEIGLLLLELQKIKNPAPGLIETSTKDDGVQAFTVCPFDIRHPFDLEWKVKQATSKTLEADNEKFQYWYEKDTFHFFATQFGRWRAEELQSSPISILGNDQMHRLTDVVSAMNRLGIFDNNHNCLTHMDLAPRNIMVETGPDDFIKITAILDWDGTFFAPKFVSCRPPWWLWQDEHFPEDAMAEETNADVKPEDPELLEVKSLFEATVGDEYIRFAYQPQYRLARRLFQIALYGNYSSWSVNEIKKILDDWEDLYKVGFENNESRSDPASPKSVALEDGNDSQGELESQVH